MCENPSTDSNDYFTSCSFFLYSVPSTPPSSVPSSPPSNVAFTYRSKNQLKISWQAPHRNSWNSELTRYEVCYSDKGRTGSCSVKNAQSTTAAIKNLQPSTKYFVTVAAGTRAGYGPKSAEISKITNGSKTPS